LALLAEEVEGEESGEEDGQEEEDGGGGAYGRDLRAVAREWMEPEADKSVRAPFGTG
jgi:hypothetical protein